MQNAREKVMIKSQMSSMRLNEVFASGHDVCKKRWNIWDGVPEPKGFDGGK